MDLLVLDIQHRADWDWDNDNDIDLNPNNEQTKWLFSSEASLFDINDQMSQEIGLDLNFWLPNNRLFESSILKWMLQKGAPSAKNCRTFQLPEIILQPVNLWTSRMEIFEWSYSANAAGNTSWALYSILNSPEWVSGDGIWIHHFLQLCAILQNQILVIQQVPRRQESTRGKSSQWD